jgi:hypothetical protein
MFLDRRRVLTGIGEGGEPRTMPEYAGLLFGQYDTCRAGMLMNTRPDGSIRNW